MRVYYLAAFKSIAPDSGTRRTLSTIIRYVGGYRDVAAIGNRPLKVRAATRCRYVSADVRRAQRRARLVILEAVAARKDPTALAARAVASEVDVFERYIATDAHDAPTISAGGVTCNR